MHGLANAKRRSCLTEENAFTLPSPASMATGHWRVQRAQAPRKKQATHEVEDRAARGISARRSTRPGLPPFGKGCEGAPENGDQGR